MSPVEVAYQEELKRSGLAIPLSVHPAFRASLNRTLDLLERSSDQVVSRAVRLGRFEVDGDDVLLMPNDEDLLRRLRLAVGAVAGNDREDLTLRVRAQDLLRLIQSIASAPEAAAESCTRSPCGPPKDPKVEEDEIMAALEQVGQPKQKQHVYLVEVASGSDESDEDQFDDVADEEDVADKKKQKRSYVVGLRRTGSVYRPPGRLTVACGLGVDSTAILVGLAQEYMASGDPKWIPEAITFADTGGEHPETYAFLDVLNGWLRRVGFPTVTVVAWATEMTRKGWGTGVTLEINSINNNTVPSISVGGHSCSNKFKIQPQQAWLAQFFAGRLGLNETVVRAIGYDATEEKRLVKGGTYVASKEEEDSAFRAWYPLIEWGWDRSRCIAEIAVAFGSRSAPAWDLVPRKSSCFFCGAMTPEEIILLASDGHKDLLKRAIFMEQVALMDWAHSGPPRTFKGLGRQFSWTDFALARLDNLPPRQQAVIVGGVLREDRGGRWRAVHLGPPSEYTGTILPTDRLVEPSDEFPLLTPSEVQGIKASARAWIDAGPSRSGDVTNDLAFSPAARRLPAYSNVLGFRGTPHMTWDRFEELAGIWEERADRGDVRAEKVLRSLGSLEKRLYGGRRLPVL